MLLLNTFFGRYVARETIFYQNVALEDIEFETPGLAWFMEDLQTIKREGFVV